MGNTRKPNLTIRHRIVDYGPGQNQRPEDVTLSYPPQWNFRVMTGLLKEFAHSLIQAGSLCSLSTYFVPGLVQGLEI